MFVGSAREGLQHQAPGPGHGGRGAARCLAGIPSLGGRLSKSLSKSLPESCAELTSHDVLQPLAQPLTEPEADRLAEPRSDRHCKRNTDTHAESDDRTRPGAKPGVRAYARGELSDMRHSHLTDCFDTRRLVRERLQ